MNGHYINYTNGETAFRNEIQRNVSKTNSKNKFKPTGFKNKL
jgi:hypothetical protein